MFLSSFSSPRRQTSCGEEQQVGEIHTDFSEDDACSKNPTTPTLSFVVDLRH